MPDTIIPEKLHGLEIVPPSHNTELEVVSTDWRKKIRLAWKPGWKQIPRYELDLRITTLRDAIRAPSPRRRLHILHFCPVYVDLDPTAAVPRWGVGRILCTGDAICEMDEIDQHIDRWLSHVREETRHGRPGAVRSFQKNHWPALAPITRFRARGGHLDRKP